MPELPEVETVRRELEPELRGRRIERAQVDWLRTLGGQSQAAFAQCVEGRRIVDVRRRGKLLWIPLSVRRPAIEGHVFIHLRMTGRLVVDAESAGDQSWQRVALHLDRSRVLRFIDPRKFGRIRYAADSADVLGKLGPEPIDEDFDAGMLGARLQGRRGRIKPLLLDQSFVAGLGNIYVDEALYRAGIHPLAVAGRIGRLRVQRLCDAMRAVLEEAIAAKGSSFDAFYRTPSGAAGAYQEAHLVYGRAGEPCHRCAAIIRRIVVGQRGTAYCPRCQRP